VRFMHPTPLTRLLHVSCTPLHASCTGEFTTVRFVHPTATEAAVVVKAEWSPDQVRFPGTKVLASLVQKYKY
jgi:hypothetical protein